MRAAVIATIFLGGLLAVLLVRPAPGPATNTPSVLQAAPVAAQTVALDPDKDAGREIVVDAPGSLLITLETIPSTGHRWDIDGSLPPNLRLQSSSLLDSDAALPGATKRQQLHFEVLTQGRAQITLIYRQPWNQTAPPLKRLSFFIIAK